MKRSPMKRRRNVKVMRAGRVPQNPAYLDYIRQWPCLLQPSGRCEGIVEAAHVGDRGLGQKCPDEETIPLCAGHHRTRNDSHHVLGRKFWGHHGGDRETTLVFYQSVFEAVPESEGLTIRVPLP